MDIDDIKYGQLVRIRQWDEMVDEFGLESDDHISVPNIFVGSMARFCGKLAKIRTIDYDKNYIRLSSCIDDFNNIDGLGSWNYSAEMLEPAWYKFRKSIKPAWYMFMESIL